MSDQKQKYFQINRDVLQFLLQAAMPIVIAIVGVIFTYTNSKRQIEFQQIQVADAMISQVRNDDGFSADKLDLQLNFVEKMFRDEYFKKQVKDLLLQTYSINLKADAENLERLALSDDPRDIEYVQSRISEAKKFNDTSVNKVVKKIEQNDAVKLVADAGAVEQKAKEQLATGEVDAPTLQQLKNMSRMMPQDSSLNRVLRRAEKKQQSVKGAAGNTDKTLQVPDTLIKQPGQEDEKKVADTIKKKNSRKKK